MNRDTAGVYTARYTQPSDKQIAEIDMQLLIDPGILTLQKRANFIIRFFKILTSNYYCKNHALGKSIEKQKEIPPTHHPSPLLAIVHLKAYGSMFCSFRENNRVN